MVVVGSLGAQAHGGVVGRTSTSHLKIESRLVVANLVVSVAGILKGPALVLCLCHGIDAHRGSGFHLKARSFQVHVLIAQAVDIEPREVASVVLQSLQCPLLVGVVLVFVLANGCRIDCGAGQDCQHLLAFLVDYDVVAACQRTERHVLALAYLYAALGTLLVLVAVTVTAGQEDRIGVGGAIAVKIHSFVCTYQFISAW